MSNHLRIPTKEASATDESLWERFTQGDREAYQQLYSEHLNALYTYGYKVFPNKAVVADLIQDLFIDLWKYKDNVSPIKNIKPYLFRSLRNKITKAVSHHRYIAYDMEAEYSNVLVVLPFENQLTDHQTQTETAKKLQRAFLALSKRQREVINLLFYEKFSYEEVAAIMNINVRSVYTLAWKALSVLRKALSGLMLSLLGSLFAT